MKLYDITIPLVICVLLLSAGVSVWSFIHNGPDAPLTKEAEAVTEELGEDLIKDMAKP